MKLSLVVPCYNEENNISLLYDAIKSDFDLCGYEYEIVFVNDGSTDGTLREMKKLLDREIPIKIINFTRNFGKESAMYAGLKESCGDYVSIIDADLQQRPAIARNMVEMLEHDSEYDCIAAFQDKRKESRIMNFFKTQFYKTINKFSDTKFVDGASDFRTLRRPMVEAVLEMDEYFRFSKGLFSWVGFNTKFIPYEASERATGTSKWSFRSLFKYALEGIIAFTTAPLKIATGVGLITSLVSIAYIIGIIIEKLAFGIDVKGYATIVVLILLMGGLQLCFIGIIGEYIARIYIQTKGRPIYIAKNIYTNQKKDEKSK